MKKFISILVIAIVVITSNTYAQYAGDALRFSQTNYGSTARFKAMGNAQIGVGGDLSSIGGNPAGLGLFTKSEFSLTPEFNQSSIGTNYLGNNTNTDKGQLNINQLGAAFFVPSFKQKGQSTNKGLISAVFGIGYNRNNDFSMESNYAGNNNSTSIADYFAQLAGTKTVADLADGSLEKMAYDNYLISRDNGTGTYFPETYADATTSNAQRKNEIRTGSVSEFNFAGALNISNQFYIGASIGLVDIKYTSDAQYVESGKARGYDVNGNLIVPTQIVDYKLAFNQNQVTKGSGVNGRIGAIFRPISSLRFGANIQTPTWFIVDDSYTEGLDDTQRGTSDSETYNFTYRLRTPFKGSFGASYVIAGTAIISADVDFVDYASTRFSSNDGGDNTIIASNNADIRNNYQGAVNYRVGAEYKINTVSIRAGYGLNGSPYKNDSDNTFDTKTYSAGLGYRVNNYFIDLAYQKVKTNGTFSPYTLNNGNEPIAIVDNQKNNVFLTFGLRF